MSKKASIPYLEFEMAVSIVVTGAAGRMGSTICRMVADDPNLKLVAVVERPGKESGLVSWDALKGTSLNEILPQVPGTVIIDFSAPEASVCNAKIAAKHGNALVIGTTGLSAEQKDEIAAEAAKTPVFWSPNMSIGVNVLLAILPKLAQALGESYDMEIMEIHHKLKKDSPSGTALRLAEALAEARDWELDEVGQYHREGIIGERPHKEIGVQTLRGGDVVGVHTVYFLGPGERIEINHQAHSREMFAKGAIRAAIWLASQKPGKLYAMPDMLDV